MIKGIFKSGTTALSELLSGSFWSILGSLISKGLLFIVWIVVAKILAPEAYGEFSMVKSTTLMFSDFVGMSFSIAATKYIAQYFGDKEKLSKLLGFFLVWGGVLGFISFLILFFLSDWIADVLLNASYLSDYLAVSSAVIFVSVLNNSQLGVLRGFNKYNIVAKINLIQILFSFPIFILFTYFFRLKGAVVSYILYNLIICIITQFELRKFCKSISVTPDYSGFLTEIKLIVSFVLPYLLSSLVWVIAQWYNETQLASLQNVGFKELGYYSAVNVIQVTIISFSIMVCSPLVPIMSKYKYDNSIGMLQKINMLLPLYVSILVAVPLVLFPEIVAFLYGSNYSDSRMFILTIIITSYTVLIVYRQSVSRLVAVYEYQWLNLVESISLSIMIVVGFYFMSQYGVLGLALTFLFSYIISILIFTPIYVRKGLIKLAVLFDRYLMILLIMLIISSASFFIFRNIYIRLIIFVLEFCFIFYGMVKILKRYGIFIRK